MMESNGLPIILHPRRTNTRETPASSKNSASPSAVTYLNTVLAEYLASHGYVVVRLLVAPEALSRFYHEDHKRIGASWMTREDRDTEMEDYVRYLDLLHDQLFEIVERDRLKLRLLGYSQGAATAARWAVRGRAKIDHLVLWGSPLPPELGDEAALREIHLTLVGGSRDEFFIEKVWADERTRLRALGLVFDELSFEGGHRLDDDTLRALAG